MCENVIVYDTGLIKRKQINEWSEDQSLVNVGIRLRNQGGWKNENKEEDVK